MFLVRCLIKGTSPAIPFLSRNFYTSRIINKHCKDKNEKNSKPAKQCGKKSESPQGDFSSKKQRCCRRTSQGSKTDSYSCSKPKSAAKTSSFCNKSQGECDQKLQDIQKTVIQAVCEIRQTREIVETHFQGRCPEERHRQGVSASASPPGKSTCKYKKLSTFFNLIGLAFLANLAYCIYKHEQCKEKLPNDENSDERT